MFGNYSKQAPQAGVTRPCVLHRLRNADGSHPVVHVEHLSRDNKSYWLELLAKTQDRARSVSAISTPAELDRKDREERADNRETMIRHSARRIENVFHADGSPAGEKDLAGFIRSIPDEDFDTLFAFASSSGNFRDYPITGDPQAIAGE